MEQVPDDLLALAHEFIPVNWALRTREDPTGLVQSVERVVRGADPLLSITAFRSMDEVVGGAIAATRFRTFVLGLFAAVALILAEAGLYGLVAYAVVQQRKEIGIRLALGASSGRVTARFARQGIVIAVVGGTLGGGAAVLVTELLRRLTDAQPLDPWTVAAVLLVLGAVSAAATVIPARRAARGRPDADAARRVTAATSPLISIAAGATLSGRPAISPGVKIDSTAGRWSDHGR